jgi:hydrogenase maturation protease
MRVIVAGVGYRNLRDHSAGLHLIDEMASVAWPSHVSVEDLSYNPIAVVQRFEDDPPDRRFSHAIVVAAVARGMARPPGAVTAYRWDGVLPANDEIHQAVCDAVTGIIHVDNTLIVTRHFRALPDEVAVVEVEPLDDEFGDELSLAVAAGLRRARNLVESLIVNARQFDALPLSGLGGPGVVRISATNGRRF